MLLMKDETVDSIFDQRFQLIQDRYGYRFSIDPLLLADFVKIKNKDQVIDLGSGNGIIALLLSKLWPKARFVAVELQPHLADQALRNSIINGVNDRVQVLHENIQNLPGFFPSGSFDVVVSNPPYRAPNSGRVNPNTVRAKARHEIFTSLENFILISKVLLKNGGRAYFTFPGFRLAELISLLKGHQLEPKTLQLVYSSIEAEARYFLIEACKNRQVGLRTLSPLILYQPDGLPSPAMKGIYDDYTRKIRLSE